MVAEEPQIITKLDENFKREFAEHLSSTIPVEKAMIELKQQELARIMAAEGSCRINGLGQQVAKINPRLFFRWLHENGNAAPHHWIEDLLADNPQLCAKGYRPRKNSLRHGHTFIAGESVSKTKGRVQL